MTSLLQTSLALPGLQPFGWIMLAWVLLLAVLGLAGLADCWRSRRALPHPLRMRE